MVDTPTCQVGAERRAGSNPVPHPFQRAQDQPPEPFVFSAACFLTTRPVGYLAAETGARGEAALLLAPNPGTHQNTYLTTSGVAALHSDANLAFSIACNTAGPGGVPGAEALSGLARAFFLAGAQSVLVSLWPVEDKSAADVASQFFKLGFLGAQDTQAGALRGAKLSVINRGGFASHPAFWAPFVLIGDGRRSLSSGATAHASSLNPLLLSEKK